LRIGLERKKMIIFEGAQDLNQLVFRLTVDLLNLGEDGAAFFAPFRFSYKFNLTLNFLNFKKKIFNSTSLMTDEAFVKL